MGDATPNAQGGGGGVAIRGFLVQTLVALLDIASNRSTFSEITLQPNVGENQFDFLWKSDSGSHAKQVKSSARSFTRGNVEAWARRLQQARADEQCTLVLVGNIPPSLMRLSKVDKVAIETKSLDLNGLEREAAQRIAEFMEGEGLHAGTAGERLRAVHTMQSKLLHLSTTAAPLTRAKFIELLRLWISEAPPNPIDGTSRDYPLLRLGLTSPMSRTLEIPKLRDATSDVQRRLLYEAGLKGLPSLEWIDEVLQQLKKRSMLVNEVLRQEQGAKWKGSLHLSNPFEALMPPVNESERFALEARRWYKSTGAFLFMLHGSHRDRARSYSLGFTLSNEGRAQAEGCDVKVSLPPELAGLGASQSMPHFVGPLPPPGTEFEISARTAWNSEQHWYGIEQHRSAVERGKELFLKEEGGQRFLWTFISNLEHGRSIKLGPFELSFGDRPASEVQLMASIHSRNQPEDVVQEFHIHAVDREISTTLEPE